MSDTTAAVLGMIVAFLTAFLAEPAKGYVADLIKLRRLRRALYGEVLYNYHTVGGMVLKPTHGAQVMVESTRFTGKTIFRRDCYQQATSTDVTFFYRLKESAELNTLYACLELLMRSEEVQRPKSKAGFTELYETIRATAEMYMDVMLTSFQKGRLDKRILRSLVSEREYFEILNAGSPS